MTDIAKGQQVPVNIVGGSTFGRYKKIGIEKTVNMFATDNWLVNFAGFEKAKTISNAGVGRGLFYSVVGDFLLAVVGNAVYRLDVNLSRTFVGSLSSTFGEVSIDENLNNQILIADGVNGYLYNHATGFFGAITMQNSASQDISPSYVEYHNTYFLVADETNSNFPSAWYIYRRLTDTTLELVAQLALQTKPDKAVAVRRLPGRGNNVIVFGTTVSEIWTNVASGSAENPYRRVQSYNIDIGCINTDTIASNDKFVAWLGSNEKSEPKIYVTDGTQAKSISTDGIDYVMQTLKRPDKSTAIMYQQDGHLFYQLTFFDSEDNVTFVYDFNTQTFYNLEDQDSNYHPARQLAYYNQKTYFISINTADVYLQSTDILVYKYSDDDDDAGHNIPRYRVCKTLRKEDGSRFRCGKFTFILEQGVNTDSPLDTQEPESCTGLLITEDGNPIISEDGAYMLAEFGFCTVGHNGPIVELAVSKNGNQSFTTWVPRALNPEGAYRNEINWHRIGQANELTFQIRFYGLQRFVCTSAVAEIY